MATAIMTTCLVTGASGFVGRHLCEKLIDAGYSLRFALRREIDNDDPLLRLGEATVVGDINGGSNWSAVLKGVATVVHLANRAHVMRESSANPLACFREVNEEGTRRLAEQAAQFGVRRLVYLSTVKVLGEATTATPFHETDSPNPQDPYAVSKWEAELALKQVSSETGLEIVLLRPPLVYGPGVGANFLSLMRWVLQGVPLPLAAIENRRSMIYVGNLAGCIATCLEHTEAAGNTFLVSDGEAVSTSSLVSRIAAVAGVPDRSWSLPPALLHAVGNLVGKGTVVRRLTESLEVSDKAIRRDLGWQPQYSLIEGLGNTVEWFRSLR
jgi:UDP-glucose 4-epimerase